MTFSSRYTLKDLRELNRLSLRQVSRKTKLSSKRITELEQDSSFITIAEMYRFSELYGISVKYIFLGEQDDFDEKVKNILEGKDRGQA